MTDDKKSDLDKDLDAYLAEDKSKHYGQPFEEHQADAFQALRRLFDEGYQSEAETIRLYLLRVHAINRWYYTRLSKIEGAIV